MNKLFLSSLLLATFSASAFAQKAVDAGSGANIVYRCPNNYYTGNPIEAKEKHCTVVEANISTIGEAFKPARERNNKEIAENEGDGKAKTKDSKEGKDNKEGKSARNSSPEQKARESDRRKILEDELKSAQDKLTELKKDYNNGEPDRRGDERNFSKYQERVSQMKADLTRAEADVTALKREIGNLKD